MKPQGYSVEARPDYVNFIEGILKTYTEILEYRFQKKEAMENNDSRLQRLVLPCQDSSFRDLILGLTEIIPNLHAEAVAGLLAENYGTSISSPGVIDALAYTAPKFEKMRRLYLRLISSNFSQNYEDSIRELTLRELLKYDKDSMKKPFQKFQLQKALLPFFMKHPKLFTWEELYQKHISIYNDCTHSVRKLTPKPKPAKHGGRPKAGAEMLKEKYGWGNPWKSTRKIEAYGERYKWKPEEVSQEFQKHHTDTWDQTKQRKLMKHFYGPRFSFVVDYMFAGKFAYMVAINMNTRKAFAIPAQKIIETENYWRAPSKVKETATDAIESLKKLMKQTDVKHLLSDQEPAWTSKLFQNFCQSVGIQHKFYHKNNFRGILETQEPSRGTHSSTSLVDRLIRTLRTMAYNLTGKAEIDPYLMEYIVYEYNHSPHTTLSKYLKKQITPEEVNSNKDLEEAFVQKLVVENMNVKLKPEYKVNKFVRVRNEASHMDKVKPQLLPGYWEVVGKDGGLLKLKQGTHEIKVNRWMVKNQF